MSSPRTRTSREATQHGNNYKPPTARTVEEEYLHSLGSLSPVGDTEHQPERPSHKTRSSFPETVAPELTSDEEANTYSPKLYGRVESYPSQAWFKKYRRCDGDIDRPGLYVSRDGGVKKSKYAPAWRRLYRKFDEHAFTYEALFDWGDTTNRVDNSIGPAGPGALAELAEILGQLDVSDTGGEEAVEGVKGEK
ncbi:hypothetical protein CkaCkLH20_10251 [Colletotrichum karsti]|uniref:Uncharacterized protein n=1 Tax=Colletotrichum karsti TaxID=1095194 RepID=A0A9P6HXV9_9PEZI|nr:uncharacterized protein CkaCkLH20_10251 [Colletotrichum karsti]KAF9872424.1 hypothetical protein CkaCkLH20_10251 [Colletotrichum karsti]